jgi:sphingomyelin phosphodiesterase
MRCNRLSVVILILVVCCWAESFAKSNSYIKTASNSDDIPRHMKHVVTKFSQMISNNLTSDINSMKLRILKHPISFKPLWSCYACEAGINSINIMLKRGLSYDVIAETASILCTDAHVEKKNVCFGIIARFKDELLNVLSNTTLTSQQICGWILEKNCASHSELEWNVTFPDVPKPPVTPFRPPKAGQPKLRVLHLTDLHVDLHYRPGSNADCGKPLCCQDGQPEVGSDPAGYWGDYRHCDIPTWTIDDLFKQLSAIRFDYILWTGDLPSHELWTQTRGSQLAMLEYLTNLFLKYFPNTPVYPSLGNHESVPVNSFPPPFVQGNLSDSWLYDGLYKSWSHWLPNTTAANISKAGFYTTLVAPKFRIVSLNMNYCNNMNWWLFINGTDPASELETLIKILQEAENSGEKVHIIEHIPPGIPDCMTTWSWNYYKIINRYENVIAGQFFGHTHFDSWEVFYDIDSGYERPVSVAYIAPSVTSYSYLNPGYRVYEIDGLYSNSSWAVLDHETFIMNLTESNLKQKTVWFKEYSAKEAYNMTYLTAQDWDSTYKKIAKDDELFKKYFQYYYKSQTKDRNCDASCREKMLCEIRSGRSYDPEICKRALKTSANLDKFYSDFLDWSREKNVC